MTETLAPNLQTVLAANLRAERNRADLSQGDLAFISGVSVSTIARIEDGKGCTVEVVGKMAAALQISADSLIRERTDITHDPAGRGAPVNGSIASDSSRPSDEAASVLKVRSRPSRRQKVAPSRRARRDH